MSPIPLGIVALSGSSSASVVAVPFLAISQLAQYSFSTGEGIAVDQNAIYFTFRDSVSSNAYIAGIKRDASSTIGAVNQSDIPGTPLAMVSQGDSLYACSYQAAHFLINKADLSFNQNGKNIISDGGYGYTGATNGRNLVENSLPIIATASISGRTSKVVKVAGGANDVKKHVFGSTNVDNVLYPSGTGAHMVLPFQEGLFDYSGVLYFFDGAYVGAYGTDGTTNSISSPIAADVSGTGVIYSISSPNNATDRFIVTAFTPNVGTHWQKRITGFSTWPSLNSTKILFDDVSDSVVIIAGANLICLDASTGSTKWAVTLGTTALAQISTNLVVDSGLIYVMIKDTGGRIYIISYPVDGSITGSFNVGAISFSISTSSITFADSTIPFGTLPDDYTGYTELTSTAVAGTVNITADNPMTLASI